MRTIRLAQLLCLAAAMALGGCVAEVTDAEELEEELSAEEQDALITGDKIEDGRDEEHEADEQPGGHRRKCALDDDPDPNDPPPDPWKGFDPGNPDDPNHDD